MPQWNSYWRRRAWFVLALILVAVTPLIFQKDHHLSRGECDRSLVVVTPHNETIRNEFTHAFQNYWQEKTGEKVYIDWRTPGGTAEVLKVVEASQVASQKRGEAMEIDVFFGGGEYLFETLAKRDLFEPLHVFEKKPEWFATDGGIPEVYLGERYYSDEKLWTGVCLSQFGICYNTDVLERLGLDAPQTWDDLGKPEFFGLVAMADPLKSGSVTKAFEMMMQQKIAERLVSIKRKTGETETDRRNRAVSHGWADGLRLIQRIAANSRYFTDSATKIVHDVAQGEAAVGVCIDFYGRAYQERFREEDGSPGRLQWVAPRMGTSMSADSVAVMKNAAEAELAQGFVEFLLSDAGQLLWSNKVGAKYGPKRRVLGRLPIRPQIYSEANREDFAFPENDAYSNDELLVYLPELTGPMFGVLRVVLKGMCMDVHDELRAAWSELIAAGVPPLALNHFQDVSYVSYMKSKGELRSDLSSRSRGEFAAIMKRLSGVFKRNYVETIRLTEER